jgi:pimeloyl-ACP methyl ester carboxylesterase
LYVIIFNHLQSLLEQSQAAVKFFMDGTIINKLGVVPNRVLILHGVQDRLMPVRNALLGAWKLLGSWMLQFPGEGHGIPFSNAQAVIT